MIAALLFLLTAAAVPSDKGLAVFDRVEGQCWEAEVGEGALDVHCFEPVYGGAHVRDRHRVLKDGKAVYEGETIYSREGQHIVFVYFNSQGDVGYGEAFPQDDGIRFTLQMGSRSQDALQAMQSRWQWQQDGYLVTTSTPSVHFRRSDKRF